MRAITCTILLAFACVSLPQVLMLTVSTAMGGSAHSQSSYGSQAGVHAQSYSAPTSFDTTGQVAPPGVKPRVTATLWEDEGSLCFQIEAKGVCVARREGKLISDTSTAWSTTKLPCFVTKCTNTIRRQSLHQWHEIVERCWYDSRTSRWNSQK